MMNDLLRSLVLPTLGIEDLATLHDSATIALGASRLAFTTDSYVVSPLFFPGGDIGSLAVHGTINDLAMAGAAPLCLSASLIIEEGFPIADLRRVLESMAKAARATGVAIVTGDTKVVDRGKGDGLYINTSGIGRIAAGLEIGPRRIQVGDAVILSGDLGRHSVAIMARRAGIAFETTIETDSAPLHALVADLAEIGDALHCLRDLTRGGLASALIELAEAAEAGVRLRSEMIPVAAGVRGACEILGLDPLYLANEGRCVVLVAPNAAERTLQIMRRHAVATDAAIIGEVVLPTGTRVVLENELGSARAVPMLSGEQLPRIC